MRPAGTSLTMDVLLALGCSALALWVQRGALGVYFHPDDLISLERARGLLPTLDYGPWRLLSGRLFFAAALEALRCYGEGIATPEDIDAGMRLGYGWAAGPFEVIDGAGVDVMAGIFMVLGFDPPPQIQEMLEKGWLGRKTGRGFYEYGPDGKKIGKTF